jgi:hypothetical protein
VIRYQNAVFSRTRDRLPHSGQAVFGPYTDHRALIADRVVLIVCAVAFVAAWMLP